MKFLSLALISISLLLVSCGTHTGKKYSKVIVRDFPNQTASKAKNVATSSRNFPNLIAASILKTNSFYSVSRSGKADADTLLIVGEITRYAEKNDALRFIARSMMVGEIGRYVEANSEFRPITDPNVGKSDFDANIRFVDGSTGEVLTTNTGKNNSSLGSVLKRSSNTGNVPVKNLMENAAEKVGQQAVKYAKSSS